jgi:very-short-patch-repair endonuclease
MRQERAISPEVVLARIAANQHGVVSLDQLLAAGISPEGISRRVRAGRLHRIHRGVYAVGHNRLSYEGRCKAAVLACGPGTVISHRTAAALWTMLPTQPNFLEVTVPTHGGRRKRQGIRLHRSTALHPADTTLRSGIPVTTPARTLTDLRRCATAQELGKAHREAEIRGYRIDDLAHQPDPTRSELERRFLRLCRRHHLPSPEVNVAVGEYVVDFLWHDRSLVVETDGYRYHRGRAAFKHDYRRQARLIALGYDVLRFTWYQVVDDPEEVIAALVTRLWLNPDPAAPPRSGVRARLRTPRRPAPRP